MVSGGFGCCGCLRCLVVFVCGGIDLACGLGFVLIWLILFWCDLVVAWCFWFL